jgi:hypothetical protein
MPETIAFASTLIAHDVHLYSAFKYCCRARGEKLEKENIQYACLAKVVRDGGFLIALICRLSVMPGHCTFDMPCFGYVVHLLMSISGSHHCHILDMRYERHHFLYCLHSLHAQTIHHRLYWCYFGGDRNW